MVRPLTFENISHVEMSEREISKFNDLRFKHYKLVHYPVGLFS